MTHINPRDWIGTGQPKIGTFIFEFATPGIGQIAAAAGCDYAVIDMEHSGFGFDTVRAAIRYLQAASLPAIVRVPSKQREDISRVLDIGADGVMVPVVSSVEQARHVLDVTKYAPRGKRGVAMGFAHDRFVPPARPLDEHFATHDARTMVILQIEDARGAESADAMATMDGVDCLWVGHFDLSVSLGVPGDFAHPTFTGAVASTLAACKRRGKSAGRLAATPAECAELYRQGFDFLALGHDVGLLQTALVEGVTALRDACARPTAAAS
jgi:2-keto-3-deoxy-L-rhamnonate aldolase RhmA